MGCKKPYNPPAIAAPNSYLVVEGVINSGSDSTTIKLSKTVNLSGDTTSNAVTGATVTVEGDQNAIYVLQEASPGNYVSAGLNLDNAHQYRLRIKTATDQYLSDYVPVLNSPPIDSVSYTFSSNGINIYSNTHDPSNNIKYYRWDYGETWIFNSYYQSSFISNGDTVLYRPLNEEIFSCWARDTSNNIILGSTARLSKAVLTNNPITFVASTSVKISSEYSILVKQYALTPDAYTFWTNLKSNTEQLGSIFDAQPSQINGNIHSVTNPSEPVIGYVSVGSTSTARIFIRARDLPAWPPFRLDENCSLTSALYAYVDPQSGATVNQVNQLINYNKGAAYPLIPIYPIQMPGGPILGYVAGTPECVDCTLHGSNKLPPFWKY
jgi:hypothetical protein